MRKLISVTVLVAAAVLISWRSEALTYSQLQAERLLELSDVAAVIEITSGQVLPCGAGYHARVVKPIKGSFKTDDDINLGPYSGRGIRASYLVFLRAKPKTLAEYDAANPSNTITFVGPGAEAENARRKKQDEECFAAYPPWLEMRGGTATLEIGSPLSFDGKEAVLFEEEWNLPPQGTRKKAWEKYDSGIVSDKRSWVTVEDVIAALRRKTTR